MNRVFIFIDGNNFYFKLKELSSHLGGKFPLLDFDFKKFCEWLAGSEKLIDARYYIGALKRQRNNEKSEKMYANQQKLISKLQNQNISTVFGHLIPASGQDLPRKRG